PINYLFFPGAVPLGDTKQEWGHVTIRQGAHMFWWLYYTTADVSNYTERPLIIWLQGGPGMPSSGYGNFLEIGPLDINFERRPYSLIEDFNILFIDNPIGVGYSYVSNNETKIPKSNEEIGEDLFRFLKLFMNQKEELQKVPLYIFGESYGGKMIVEFASQIAKKKKRHKRKWNLKGIGLGNSYISPLEYIKKLCATGVSVGKVDLNLTVTLVTTLNNSAANRLEMVTVERPRFHTGMPFERVKVYLVTTNWLLARCTLACHMKKLPPLLKEGLVDKQGFTRIDELAKEIEVLINKKEFEEAADVELTMMQSLVKEMPGVDVYNFIAKTNASSEPNGVTHITLSLNFLHSLAPVNFFTTFGARTKGAQKESHLLKRQLAVLAAPEESWLHLRTTVPAYIDKFDKE
ncbi:hypothetical protein NQ317_008811, partial [Molorchus minor]